MLSQLAMLTLDRYGFFRPRPQLLPLDEMVFQPFRHAGLIKLGLVLHHLGAGTSILFATPNTTVPRGTHTREYFEAELWIVARLLGTRRIVRRYC